MGGSGSGFRGTRRCTVEDCLGLSLASLRRDGVLRAHWTGAWRWPKGQRIGITTTPVLSGGVQLTLTYTATLNGTAVPVTQTADVVWAPALGHLRPWLCCPLCGCRRAAILLPPVVPRFGCRGCYGLSYRSIQSHDSRVDRLRRALGRDWEPLDIDSPFMTLPRLKADFLGPLVRRDPRFPRRRVERLLDVGIRSAYDWGHAEPADVRGHVALSPGPVGSP